MSGHNRSYLGDDYSKLEQVRILVCGAGAVGSPLVVGLAQEGYKHLAVVDFDKVDRGNPYTQVYGLRDNGGKKTAVLRGIVAKKLNVRIATHDVRLDERNAKKILKDYDLVVDAFDNWESRILVRDVCNELGIDCVHGGMSETGFSEVKWNDHYRAPSKPKEVVEDTCEYPLAGPLVKMTAAMLQAIITHYVVTGEKLNRTFALRNIRMRELG